MPVVGAMVPNVPAMAAASIMPVPVIARSDMDDRATISVIVVRIVPMAVAVGMISVISVPGRMAKSDPHGDPRLCPWSRGKREGTNCQPNQ